MKLKALSGEIVEMNQTYRATLFFAGTQLDSNLPVQSKFPLAEVVCNLLSSQPTFIASLSKDRKIVHLVPKGGLLGGNSLMRYLDAFEKVVNTTVTADKIAEALMQNDIDPTNLPPNFSRRFLEIIASVLDPTAEFEGFSEALAETAEEQIQQFADRLAKARAPQEAWIKRHREVEDRKRLSSFIARGEKLLAEKRASLDSISEEMRSLDRTIGDKQETIARIEHLLEQQNYQDVESKKRKLLEDERRLVNIIRMLDQTTGGPQLNQKVAENKRLAEQYLRETRAALVKINESIRMREESVREVNRHKNEMAISRKQRDEAVRRSNHLKQEIRTSEDQLVDAQQKLSQLGAR